MAMTIAINSTMITMTAKITRTIIIITTITIRIGIINIENYNYYL